MRPSSRSSAGAAAGLAVLLLTAGAPAADAQDRCCFNNFRFAGGCAVVPSGAETCQSILAYLNSFDSVGRGYCGNTTVRGGWSLQPCATAMDNRPQTISPQTVQPAERIRQQQQVIEPVQPKTAPGAQEASLLQVSAPLKVRFDEELPTDGGTAGSLLTGTLAEDLVSGDGVIAPAGSTVQARFVPTSYWSDGTGDAFAIETTGIEVGGRLIPVNAVAASSSAGIPVGTPVSFEIAAPVDGSGPSATLTAAENRWMGAFNAEDADGLAALYAEDAVMLPPNAAAVFGRDAIRTSFRGIFAAGDLKAEIEPLEIVVEGDLAYVAGRYRMWTGDGSLVDRGKYLEIWRAVDGGWLIHRDIHNSSLPAEGEQPESE